MKRARITVALTLSLLACIAVDINVLRQAAPSVVDAEERGVPVALHYQRGYSTWGPTDVYGTAVLWPREGVATLSVHLLPRLEGGDRYVWWVVSTHTGAVLRLGTFNTSDAGEVFLNTFLPHGLPKEADAVVVSIAGKHDALRAPGAARSLYGAVTPQSLVQTTTASVPPAPPGVGIDVSSGKENPAVVRAATHGVQGAPYALPRVLPMTGGAQAPRERHQ